MRCSKLIIVLGSFLFFLFIGFACQNKTNQNPCYDESLVHNNPCTMDCPGFEGCDGHIYCNECIAARNGIGPKK
ncbi:hypothetical protein KFE94_15830 [bacterium SCSIO 12643]|nr:hypothetical protein KFE94_15830 [bacterium SCSIO 12643]